MTPHLPTHEIQVGAIIGIRVWYVKEGYLHSSCGGITKWTPASRRVARKETEFSSCLFCPGGSAPCILDRSVDPTAIGNLQCGLHAAPDLDYFPTHVVPYSTIGVREGHEIVFGLVRLFGRVVEGNCGWRAEFAEVHALCDGVPSPLFHRCDDVTLTNMALRYEVPVLCLEELSAQATLIKEEPPHETI